MTAEENLMELREKQAFWAGVVRGFMDRQCSLPGW